VKTAHNGQRLEGRVYSAPIHRGASKDSPCWKGLHRYRDRRSDNGSNLWHDDFFRPLMFRGKVPSGGPPPGPFGRSGGENDATGDKKYISQRKIGRVGKGRRGKKIKLARKWGMAARRRATAFRGVGSTPRRGIVRQ